MGDRMHTDGDRSTGGESCKLVIRHGALFGPRAGRVLEGHQCRLERAGPPTLVLRQHPLPEGAQRPEVSGLPPPVFLRETTLVLELAPTLPADEREHII